MLKKLGKILSARLTFLVVPNGSGSPRQISLNISLLLLGGLTWTLITVWGSYLSAQHVDYWKSNVANRMLKTKIKYLSSQIDASRGMLDEVREIETQLRSMIDLNEQAVGKKTETKKPLATGGPTAADEAELRNLLDNETPDFTWNLLVDKISGFKSEAKDRVFSYKSLKKFLADQRSLYKAIPRGWPCPGERTSHFGKRIDPFTKNSVFHFGVDIAGKTGTPINATADGTVRIASWKSGYGKLVVIDHNYGYSTRYAHNSKILVKPGERIKRGQKIALLGSTGKSTAPHCHYEVWKNRSRKNPYPFMEGNPANINALSRLPDDQLPL